MANVAAKATEKKETAGAKPKEPVGKTLKGAPAVVRGICVTCNCGADCAHLVRNPGVVIWHCENYEDYVRPGEKVPEVTIPYVADGVPPAGGTETAAGELKGLCIDCECRGGCAHATKTGGVWHCEEYQ